MPLTDKEATPLEELPVLTATAMAGGTFIRVPTDASEDTRRSKKTATILSAVYRACILLVVAYLAKGLRDPTFR